MVYIGTMDACWINRMLAGCQVQIRSCDLLGGLISGEYSNEGQKE